MRRNRSFMPTPLCQKPQCGRAQTGVAVENGLGVAHCNRHGDWAKDAVVEIVELQKLPEDKK